MQNKFEDLCQQFHKYQKQKMEKGNPIRLEQTKDLISKFDVFLKMINQTSEQL